MTKTELELGYNLLKGAIRDYIDMYQVSYKVTDNAPSTYNDMVESREALGYFVVYNGGDHGHLGWVFNAMFRAVHDHGHFTEKLTFKFNDERQLGKLQAVQLATMPCVPKKYRELVRSIVLAEINGQIDYYEQNKEYVKDQTEFINNYMGV